MPDAGRRVLGDGGPEAGKNPVTGHPGPEDSVKRQGVAEP